MDHCAKAGEALMSDGWKEKERLVAEWFGSHRNPLSGGNNVNDEGGKRLGDLVYKPGIVEVKRRKNNAFIGRAKHTRMQANSVNLPWLHIEFSTRQPDIVGMVMDYDLARDVVRFIRMIWESDKED